MGDTCQLTRRLLRCGQTRLGGCQYCGRGFCSAHGTLLGDGQEVCARQQCQRKLQDLEAFAAYKASVSGRNGERLCGQTGCRHQAMVECAKCRGLFCELHVQVGEVTEWRAERVVTRRATLCRHCLKRRRIWAKT